MVSSKLPLLHASAVWNQVQDELNNGPEAEAECHKHEAREDNEDTGDKISDLAAIRRFPHQKHNHTRSDESFDEEEDRTEDPQEKNEKDAHKDFFAVHCPVFALRLFFFK